MFRMIGFFEANKQHVKKEFTISLLFRPTHAPTVPFLTVYSKQTVVHIINI